MKVVRIIGLFALLAILLLAVSCGTEQGKDPATGEPTDITTAEVTAEQPTEEKTAEKTTEQVTEPEPPQDETLAVGSDTDTGFGAPHATH